GRTTWSDHRDSGSARGRQPHTRCPALGDRGQPGRRSGGSQPRDRSSAHGGRFRPVRAFGLLQGRAAFPRDPTRSTHVLPLVGLRRLLRGFSPLPVIARGLFGSRCPTRVLAVPNDSCSLASPQAVRGTGIGHRCCALVGDGRCRQVNSVFLVLSRYAVSTRSCQAGVSENHTAAAEGCTWIVRRGPEAVSDPRAVGKQLALASWPARRSSSPTRVTARCRHG